MVVEIQYFSGCPNAEPAIRLVEETLLTEGVAAEIRRREITSEEDAVEYHFLGSPTIQVDGLDIDPSSRTDTNYALTCRIYQLPGGASGVPSKDMLREALSEK